MKKIKQILQYFDELYPDAHCELEYNTPYQLLVAVILSAQCTDKRVNIVTKELFKIAPTAQEILNLGETKLKSIIHSCGFFNNKANSIISASRELLEKYDGKIPNTIEELTALAGVGRKTANVVLAECYQYPSLAVDTHVHRVSKRLNLTKNDSTPLQCELDLMSVIPIKERIKCHHQMIWFGRYFCKSINPNCANCKIKNICKYYKQNLAKPLK